MTAQTMQTKLSTNTLHVYLVSTILLVSLGTEVRNFSDVLHHNELVAFAGLFIYFFDMECQTVEGHKIISLCIEKGYRISDSFYWCITNGYITVLVHLPGSSN